MAKKKIPTAGDKVDEWILVVSSLIRAFGPAVVLTLMVSSFIFIYADACQKHELIDNWILLKNENHFFCVIIILILVIAITVVGSYHSKSMRFMNKKLKKF